MIKYYISNTFKFYNNFKKRYNNDTQRKVKAWTNFSIDNYNNPAKLLIDIRVYTLYFKEIRYEVVVIINTVENLLNKNIRIKKLILVNKIF